ncbi:MAG: hypothetical protein Q4F95_02755 [Oscillospiraceae bacterium]|nr:hypothetical protein [Oscillospiraceae bacterium]
MFFLSKIDEIYETEKKQYEIENNYDFCSYIPIKPININTSIDFLIKKQEKAKLLLVCGKQRVYVSDLQVIDTVINMDINDIRWLTPYSD